MKTNERHSASVRKRAVDQKHLLPSPAIPLQPNLCQDPTHSCSPPHLLFLPPPPPSPLLPLFHLSPFPASAPHPISSSPLNKSWRDNSAIVALVWEPWTETNAVYPSSGTAWTLSFITTGPSLIKSVQQVLQ